MGSNHDDLARLASFFGGQEALSVVQALSDAGTTTDDIIAVNANVKLNGAPRVLYKLYNHALVTVVRSRDEKTRWVIYHWNLQTDKLDAFLPITSTKTLKQMWSRLE